MDKPHVLIVDDEKDICSLISDNLNELGYLCEVAFDGNCALQKIVDGNFDVTLLDIKLPGISGIELLRVIKSKSDSAVIMITAIDDVNTAVESMKLGAIDYIVKPFNLDMLNLSVYTALDIKKRSSQNTKTRMTCDTKSEEELQEMDAIAHGIEIKLDLTDNRSTIVTSKTIEIAREIGVPEEQIKQWAAKRARTNRESAEFLLRFNHNAIAQVQMGVAPEFIHDGDAQDSVN